MITVCVSMMQSRVLSAYMVRDYSNVPVRINTLELQRFIEQYQSQYKNYYTKGARSGSPIHTICYEDMAESPERFHEEIKLLWQFLRVDDCALPKVLKKNIL